MALDELSSFRLVGGTAIALQIGHRKSVDVDLFSNQKANLKKISDAIGRNFPNAKNLTITQSHISVFLLGVRVDIYDDWRIPFLHNEVVADGIRLAVLEDLAAFKLSSIVGRREKKDYIDLFFLFKSLGGKEVLSAFKQYEPLLSDKSLLFALTEVETAKTNKTPMPEMLLPIDWAEIKKFLTQECRAYFGGLNK